MNRIITVFLFLITQTVFTQNQPVTPVFQTGHYARINHVEFHSNNQHIVSCADDGRLIVWDIYLGLQFHSVIVDQAGINTFSFLTDTTLLTLTNNGQLQYWSFPELKPITRPIKPLSDIQDFAIINDSLIALAGRHLSLYEPYTNKTTTLAYASKRYFTSISYQKERNEIAISGPIDNYCAVISLDNPYVFKRYVLGNINGVKHSQKSTLLMTETNGSLVAVDVNTDEKKTYNLKDNHNYIIAVDQCENDIAIGSTYGFTQILSAEDHALIKTIGLNGVALSSLAYSPDGKWLAIANNNGMISLYEANNYKLNRILKGVSANVTDVKLFGNDLFVGYSDGIIRKLNLPDNKIISNSIKLDRYEELSGVNYTILSIDTIINEQLAFTVLKTDRHHERSNQLRSVQKIKSIWNIDKNEIILKKSVNDIQLRLQVDRNYRMGNPYQIKDYLQEPNHYKHKDRHYYFHSDSSHFVQITQGDTLIFETKHEAPIAGLRFTENYDLIISFSSDGSIRFWDTEGDYIATLYLSGQYGFTYWRPDNFYFSSKEMLQKIGFIYKKKLYAYEQFDLFYNRPNEVMKHLPYFQKKDVRDYEKAYYKRLEKLGITESTLTISEDLPELSINYSGAYSTKKDSIYIELNMNGKKENLSSYSYRINGIEHKTMLKNPAKAMQLKLNLRLAAGLNQIECYCQDYLGVKSLTKRLNITCEKNFEKPELYLVSIGVSKYAETEQNLVYAEKDAREIADLMRKNEQFKTIHTKTLLDENFTQNQFNEIQAHLQNARINDVIILYYAGHGILDENLDYYLATYDMDFKKPNEKGIAFDAVEAHFESLACRNKLIMIDACFSGEIDKSIISKDTLNNTSEDGPIRFRSGTDAPIDGGGEMGIFELAKMTFIDLNRNNSTNILSSASGVEYAMESEAWQNGLFTFVLKDGILNEKADLNGDNLIRIMELQVYLRETVSSLSKGEQNPILRKENTKNNFVIW